jgi:hypothetical protein
MVESHEKKREGEREQATGGERQPDGDPGDHPAEAGKGREGNGGPGQPAQDERSGGYGGSTGGARPRSDDA